MAGFDIGAGLQVAGQGVGQFGQNLGRGIEAARIARIQAEEAKRKERTALLQDQARGLQIEEAEAKKATRVQGEEQAAAAKPALEDLNTFSTTSSINTVNERPTGQQRLGEAQRLGLTSQRGVPGVKTALTDIESQVKRETLEGNRAEDVADRGVGRDLQQQGVDIQKEGLELRKQEIAARLEANRLARLQKVADAKAKSAAADLKGGLDVAKFESALRKEIKADKSVVEYNTTKTQFQKMATVWNDYAKLSVADRADQSKIGVDQALIMVFNKMLDPGSVVRESEFARTPEAQALIEQMKGYLPKIKSGGTGLTDKERQEIVNTSNLLWQAAGKQYETVLADYTSLASGQEDIGVKVENILQGIPRSVELQVSNILEGVKESNESAENDILDSIKFGTGKK